MREKKQYARIKAYRDHEIVGTAALDLASIKHRSTFVIQVFGFVLTGCAGFVGSFLGTVAVIAITSPLSGGIDFDWRIGVLIAVGIILELFCMFGASPLIRRFCYFLKRSYLRDVATRAEATIIGYRKHHVYRGPEQYDLILAWQHPVSGQTFVYERRYTFFWELFSSRKQHLFESCYAGAFVPVCFNARKPQQFVAEIPFVPCWFDIFF